MEECSHVTVCVQMHVKICISKFDNILSKVHRQHNSQQLRQGQIAAISLGPACEVAITNVEIRQGLPEVSDDGRVSCLPESGW